ncbi:XRE family transcriptional regulator, partial [Streptomyces sp. NPDC006514]
MTPLTTTSPSNLARALPLARVSGDAPLAASIAPSTSRLTLHTNDQPGAARWARTGLHLAAQGAPHPRPHLPPAHHDRTGPGRSSPALPRPAGPRPGRAAIAVSADAVHPWLSPFDTAALASESALILKDLGRYNQALGQAEHALVLREAGRARS